MPENEQRNKYREIHIKGTFFDLKVIHVRIVHTEKDPQA